MSSGSTGGGSGDFRSALARLDQPPMELAIANPGVQMTVGMRALQRIRRKLDRCKVNERDYKNAAFLALGVAIPCAIVALGEWNTMGICGLNAWAASFAGLVGAGLLLIDRVYRSAKVDTISSVIEDVDAIFEGFEPTTTMVAFRQPGPAE